MRRVILCLTLLSLILAACDAGGTATPALVESITDTRAAPTLRAEPEDKAATGQAVTPQAASTQSPSPPAPTSPPTEASTMATPTQPGLPQGELTIAGLQAIQLIGDPQSGDSFYALTPTGLYITRDGGLTWAQVTPAPQQDEFVFSLAEPGLLYAGAGADCYRGGPEQPFYKSINGGATWSELPNGVNLRPVAVHPADPNQIWAIGCAGPAYSPDGGETWTTPSDDLFMLYDATHVVPAFGWSVIYVGGVSEGGSGLVASSRDGGASWNALLQESPEQLFWWINDLLVAPPSVPGDPPRLFLADPHNVWRSRDGGDTWEASNEGLRDVVYRDGADFATIGLNALAVDGSTTPATVYLGTAQGVYQSLDEGETWSRLTGGPWESAPVHDLAFRTAPCRLFITSDKGVFVFAP